MIEFTGKHTNAKVMIDEIDSVTASQITTFLNHEAFTNPVAIMPDTHAGKGAVIGFTMEMTDKVIPNVVGVDIGCGMLTFCVGKNLFSSITKKEFDEAVREVVPFGANVRKDVFKKTRLFDWSAVNERIRKFTLEFNKRFGTSIAPVVMDSEAFVQMNTRVGCGRSLKSIGTLGGGNHFIEVGKSEENGNYYVTIHTGSRNFGKCVAEYWQKLAVQRMNEPKMPKSEYIEFVKANFPKKKWQDEMSNYDKFMGGKSYVPKGTEYLQGEDAYGYLVDMLIAQEYAVINRRVIATEIVGVILDLDASVLTPAQTEYIETTHNFIDFNDWIIRKGAIRSYEGEKMIIPFNMEDGLLICEGKSNPEWNYSAPHGAGRVYSRSKAKQVLSLGDATESMKKKGVYSSVIPLDEVKEAYKDSTIIEICIEPTATIVDRVNLYST